MARASPSTAPRVITFIVPAHDEEQLLGRTLAALHAAAAEIGAQ